MPIAGESLYLNLRIVYTSLGLMRYGQGSPFKIQDKNYTGKCADGPDLSTTYFRG